MKLFNMRDFYKDEFKEYVIGTKETGKHTVYLVYGEVMKGESWAMSPSGHDEILFLLAGEAEFERGGQKILLAAEQAVSMEPDERFTFTAKTDCRYVVAGAHPASHAH
jgi:quercetin dioxygenase-like cupin family protein